MNIPIGEFMITNGILHNIPFNSRTPLSSPYICFMVSRHRRNSEEIRGSVFFEIRL